MNDDIKRLFFGCEVCSPWPEKLPEARMLAPEVRHMTLVFLGNVSYGDIESLIPSMPLPPFKVGFSGFFDECLFLPEKKPRVVSWHGQFLYDGLKGYQKQLFDWLKGANYSLDEREFLPHVTLGRSPFLENQWRKKFLPLPFIIPAIHLYETTGSLEYTAIKSFPLVLPFEEIEHTADIAFKIHGENLDQIYFNAQVALAFQFPELTPFIDKEAEHPSLDDIIIRLNEKVTEVDREMGCPFKAISFHGDLQEDENGILTWEMIVDV